MWHAFFCGFSLRPTEPGKGEHFKMELVQYRQSRTKPEIKRVQKKPVIDRHRIPLKDMSRSVTLQIELNTCNEI